MNFINQYEKYIFALHIFLRVFSFLNPRNFFLCFRNKVPETPRRALLVVRFKGKKWLFWTRDSTVSNRKTLQSSVNSFPKSSASHIVKLLLSFTNRVLSRTELSSQLTDVEKFWSTSSHASGRTWTYDLLVTLFPASLEKALTEN